MDIDVTEECTIPSSADNHRARYLVGEARPVGSKALGGPGDSGQ
jgi:hypothetical protein